MFRRLPFALGVAGLLTALSAALGGCSGSEIGDDPGGDDAGAPPGTFRVTWGPLMVESGVEDVRCVTLRLGNADAVQISQIHNALGTASHHFIVYKAPPGAEEHTDPRRCSSVENLVDPDNGVPLMITQKADEVLTLPPGVAFEMEAEQLIRLELHFINATESVAEVSATSTFVPIEDGAFENAADFLFIGSPDIDIPPMEAATLGPAYTPMPPELIGAKVFGVTGHEHQWGTDVFVEMGASSDGPFETIYDVENFNWDEPETVFHDPPIEIPAEGGFRFTCQWLNQSTARVGFGEEVDDEMCFFWAYYYPSVGARTCFHTDQFNGVDVCCPSERDAAICALIVGAF